MKICFYRLSLLLCCLFLAACEPTYYWRGNFVLPEDIAKVEISKTTAKELITLWGEPSYRQKFEGKGWYYVGEETDQVTFFKPNLLKRQVIFILFDDKERVVSMTFYDSLEQAQFDYASEKTPTLGRDPAFFKEVFGSVGKFDEGKHKSGHV